MKKLLSALLIAFVLAFAPIPVHAADNGAAMSACGAAYDAYQERLSSDYQACGYTLASYSGWCEVAYTQGQLAAMGDLLACQISAYAQ